MRFDILEIINLILKILKNIKKILSVAIKVKLKFLRRYRLKTPPFIKLNKNGASFFSNIPLLN